MSMQGPNSPSIGANMTSGWANPTNIVSSNNAYASYNVPPSGTSSYLRAASFGFTVPLTSQVVGITVEIERRGSSTTLRDDTIQLLNGTTPIGTNLSFGGTWPTTEAIATFGGPTNMWGLASTVLTPTLVNSSNFGVRIAVDNISTSLTRVAYIDHVRITVHYVENQTHTRIDVTSLTSTDTSRFINNTRILSMRESDNVSVTETPTLSLPKEAVESDAVASTELAVINVLVFGMTTTDTSVVGSEETESWTISTVDSSRISIADRPNTTSPALDIPSLDDLIIGQAGTIAYTFGMRYYTDDMILVSDISNYVYNLKVDWDETRAIKRTVTFDYSPEEYELHHDHYVEPYVVMEIPIKELSVPVVEERSFGFFTQLHHRITIRQAGNSITYTGHDDLVKLVAETVNTIMTLPAGASYSTTIRNLCISAGFSDENIVLPITTSTTPSALTWEPGTTYYAIIEQLTSALNWESPYIDVDNKLYVIEMRDFNTALPDVLYATDNNSIILPDITHNHENHDVVNNIIISVDDPLRTPFAVTYTNNNVNNPYAYTNTGHMVTKLIEDLDYIASSSIASERAKLLAQRETPPHTMDLITWLDFRRKYYELYSIFVDSPGNASNHITSIWRCVAWSMNLATGGTMTHKLKEVLEV